MMKSIAAECARRPLAAILEQVATHFGVTAEEIRSPRRHRPLPAARAEFCRRAWALNQHSSTQIGGFINRDHTSVLFLIGRLQRKRPSRAIEAAILNKIA